MGTRNTDLSRLARSSAASVGAVSVLRLCAVKNANAFHGRRHAEVASQANGANDCDAVARRIKPRRTSDLSYRRGGCPSAERRIAGAKIVHGDSMAPRSECRL
jgi:hypothetical protein